MRHHSEPAQPKREERFPVIGPLVDAYGLSRPGRMRSRNEDQFLVADLTRTLFVRSTSLEVPTARRPVLGAPGTLLVVADGLGGHRAGDVASALAVESLVDFTLESMPWVTRPDAPEEDDVSLQLRRAMAHCEARVRAAAHANPRDRGMGTTLTAALVSGDWLHVAHAGDSRCYVYQRGALERMTRDHTVSELLRADGAAVQKQYQNVLYNAIGADDRDVQVELSRRHVSRGDIVILCSDGLTHDLDDLAIASEIAAGGGARVCCEALIDAAGVAGGKDDTTVVVACL